MASFFFANSGILNSKILLKMSDITYCMDGISILNLLCI